MKDRLPHRRLAAVDRVLAGEGWGIGGADDGRASSQARGDVGERPQQEGCGCLVTEEEANKE